MSNKLELEPFNLAAYSRLEPRDYQLAAFNHLKDNQWVALLSDPGMGKTKTGIDIICYHALRREIDMVILFAWPSAVHHQWVEEQLPKHWWRQIPVKSFAWDTKRIPRDMMMRPEEGSVHFLAFNIESTRSSRVMDELHKLAINNGKKIMLLVDESQRIKNNGSLSWKELKELSDRCRYKMIMTGTPIAKSLVDEWAQFNFMSYDIINMRYKTAFMAQFCQMGGFGGREVVGAKNVDVFNKMIAPYTYRATKDQLNLPPKIWDEITFDLTPQQRMAQEELRRLFELELNQLDVNDDTRLDSVLRVTNSNSMLMKLQQIANGFVVDGDKAITEFKDNPRLDAFDDFVSIEQSPKIVVWCRFRQDIEFLMRRHETKAVTYYGINSDKEKEHNKRRFINDDKVRFIIANAQSMGAGVDGLQEVCDTAIYYSQSFNSIERWQSEDRTNRFGTKTNSRYFDLIGRGSIDRMITRNVRNKKSFSDLTLGELKEAINALQV